MAKIELLDRAIARIEVDPKGWNQKHWATKTPCGTAFCLAGHIGAELGAEPDWRDHPMHTFPVEMYATSSCVIDGRVVSYLEVATDALGITPAQADCLFWARNTLEGIKAMRDALALDPEADLQEVLRVREIARALLGLDIPTQ